MRIAVMQPYLFPYIGYFQLIASVDKFVILDDVHFINKGWINRNRILINGQPTLFTVPLEKASQNKLIRDIQVSAEGKWKEKLIKTMEMAYRKAPYFEEVFPLIKESFATEESAVSKLVWQSLQWLMPYLGLHTAIEANSAGYKNEHLKAQYKILDICKQEGASHYINPIGGQEIYDRGLFLERQIQLSFIRPSLKEYKQHAPVFIPGLSIIDVLMYNSRDQVQQYLHDYTLE